MLGNEPEVVVVGGEIRCQEIERTLQKENKVFEEYHHNERTGKGLG